jgi:excinuclease ABC subunit B
VVEQVIRPTGLVDPVVEVRPASSQIDDLLAEIRKTTASGYRTLVTTLTKKLAQELSQYFKEVGVKAKYLHSDVETLERIQILRELRQGVFDVLVGINLLREGLDLPEVALVAVLDADKEGFLRSTTSLIQTIGRAARNAEGRVILYADATTNSMKAAMDETTRRRERQLAYNAEHGLIPRTITKNLDNPLWKLLEVDEDRKGRRDAESAERRERGEGSEERQELEVPVAELPEKIAGLRAQMKAAAAKLDFESAAQYRDEVRALEALFLRLGGTPGGLAEAGG